MHHHSDGTIDRGAYWRDASEDAIREVAINAFDEPNKALSNGAEIRFGKNGSKSVVVRGEKRGSWYDHQEQKGGFLLIPAEDFAPGTVPHDGTFTLGTNGSSGPQVSFARPELALALRTAANSNS